VGARATETLGHLRATLVLVWRASRVLTVALAGLTLASAVLPVAVAWAGKRIVDAVVAGSREQTLRWVMFELAIVGGLAAASRANGLVRQVLGARLGVDVNVAILQKAVALELRHFEDSEFYDGLTKARREASSRPVALVTDAFKIVESGITLAGYGVLLVGFSPWAVLALLVATVPATLAEMRLAKVAFRVRNWRSPESRKLMYLEYVLANDEHAKEVRLFGLGPLFLDRYRDLAERFYREDRALATRRSATTFALSLLATATFYGAYLVMALGAASGRLTLGDMTLYVLAFRQGQQAFQSVLGGVGSIYEHNLYMANLFSFLALPVASRPAARVEPPDTGERGVRFENVGFRYAGKPDGEWALRGVDLFVPRGESLALVGQNGAGKTTFIKLLTRLYTPTEGRIVLDGRDLANWDEAALRARIGVVFQDFAQYQLALRENVGLGSVTNMADAPRLERAVDRGGARELADGLPQKLDTQLGRWFKDGTELSGGQWQKVALARAYMREEADIVVLDEPTAALDAHAEHAVFARFRELAQGRTTIVISHRFPAVRMADRIVVLEAGRVVEEGTHDGLLARGGRYAKMFALQAEGYL